MKLDKIKFAEVVSYIGSLRPEYDLDCYRLDSLIDIEVPVAEKVNQADVEELLRSVIADDGFIPAIKAYRVLTGVGLKEAKEAIEKFRSFKEPAKLGDILNKAVNFDKFEG